MASGAHYAYVGFGHGASNEGYIFNDVYRFDPIALTWKKMGAFPGEGTFNRLFYAVIRVSMAVVRLCKAVCKVVYTPITSSKVV